MLSSQPVKSLTSSVSTNTISLEAFEDFFQLVIAYSYDKSGANHPRLNTLKNRLFDFIRLIRDEADLSGIPFKALCNTLRTAMKALVANQFFAEKISLNTVKFISDCLEHDVDAWVDLIRKNDPANLLGEMRDKDVLQEQLQASHPVPLPTIKTGNYAEFVTRMQPIQPDSPYHLFQHGLSRCGTGFSALDAQELFCRQTLSISVDKDAGLDAEFVNYVKSILISVIYQKTLHIDRGNDIATATDKINEAIAICQSLNLPEIDKLPRSIHLQVAKAWMFERVGNLSRALHTTEMAIKQLDQATEIPAKQLSELQHHLYHIVTHLLFTKYLQCEAQGHYPEARNILQVILSYKLLEADNQAYKDLVCQFQLLSAASYEKEALLLLEHRYFTQSLVACDQALSTYFKLPAAQLATLGLFGRLKTIGDAGTWVLQFVQHDLMLQNLMIVELNNYLGVLEYEASVQEEKTSANVVAFFPPANSGNFFMQRQQTIGTIQNLIQCLTNPIVDPNQRFFAEWLNYKAQFTTAALSPANVWLINAVEYLLSQLLTPRINITRNNDNQLLLLPSKM